MKQTKKTTHRKTPLALPQHSSKGRVSGFAEQGKPDDSEKKTIAQQFLLLADASTKKLQLNMTVEFLQPSLSNPLLSYLGK